MLPELSELIQVMDTCQCVMNQVSWQFYKCATSPSGSVCALGLGVRKVGARALTPSWLCLILPSGEQCAVAVAQRGAAWPDLSQGSES